MRAISSSALCAGDVEHVGLVSGLVAHLVAIGQRIAFGVFDVDRDPHRQSDPQRMPGQFLRVKRNAHRDALHHLDPVAAGILRRQQRKGGAGAGLQADHLAVVFDVGPVCIGMQRHRLADAHARNLHFLEIGVDPERIERHDRQQRRAGGDALADLHRTLGDIAADRRRQFGTRICQVVGAQLGGGALHVRMQRYGGVLGQRAVRGQLFARRLQRRFGCLQGALGVRHLFQRHRAGAEQLLAPRQIGTRALHLAAAHGDIGGQCAVIGEQRAHFAHGLRQLRFRLLQRHPRVGLVEPDQRRAGLHPLGIVDIDRHHRAADLRRHLYHVAGDIGVVGGFIVAGVEPPPDAIDDQRQQQHDGGADQQRAALAARGGRRYRRWTGIGGAGAGGGHGAF